jgi:glyoxylase-like metal-dependent hydrolase (beta-lactamase superfamily II)
MEIKRLVVGPLLTNCYILISKDKTIVIDPGAGLKKILKEIDGKELLYIILTHYHWDHTLGALKLKEKTGAKILIHKKERDFIKFQPDQFLDGGEEIRIGDEFLKIIHTPGHSKGSICILGKDFIFTGDTIFQDGFGRWDLPGGSEKDLKESLKKIKKILKSGMKVFPGHGPTFEHE